MLTDYIFAAMRHAHYEILEDETYYGEIPGLQGVYANADSLEECRDELQDGHQQTGCLSIQKATLQCRMLDFSLGRTDATLHRKFQDHELPEIDGIQLDAVPEVV